MLHIHIFAAEQNPHHRGTVTQQLSNVMRVIKLMHRMASLIGRVVSVDITYQLHSPP